MEVEEMQHLEKEHSPEYIFSLKPHNINKPTFEADFSPLRCKKTQKTIRIIPTYTEEYEVPFTTQLDRPKLRQSKSHKILGNKENKSNPHIMIPKPSNNFCQVCRQSYHDYLQHTNHPVHKMNVEEAGSHFSIDSLKEALDSPLRRYKPNPKVQSNTSLRSMVSFCSSQSNTSLDCNKFLPQTKEEQEADKLSIVSNQKCESIQQIEQVPPVIIKRRENKKYSHFRVMKEERQEVREQNQMEVEE